MQVPGGYEWTHGKKILKIFNALDFVKRCKNFGKYFNLLYYTLLVAIGAFVEVDEVHRFKPALEDASDTVTRRFATI